MPAPSPVSGLTDVSLRVTVKIDGTVLNDTILLSAIKVTHDINRISTAEVSLTGLHSMDFSSIDFSDDGSLTPGGSITISAGYGNGGETQIFSGYIVRHMLDMDSNATIKTKLICRHKAVAMTYTRREAEHKDKTDSDIISALTGAYGLSATVTSTTSRNENFIQKLATDWDIILSRAEFNGLMVFLGPDDDIKIGKPDFSTEAVLRVATGESIIDFNAELNAEYQPTKVEASGWDISKLALIKSTAAEPSLNPQGNINASTLSAKLNQNATVLNSVAPQTSSDLQTWADGYLLRMRMAAIRGTVSFVGSALVKPGDMITLEGVGARFNGNAFASGVAHHMSKGVWKTTVSFGLDKRLVSERPDFSYVAGATQIPAIHGLQVAIVKKLSEDPLGLTRILVSLSTNAESSEGVWARLASNYATNAEGAGIIPEVGDEVILGFLENDPRYPVVLGSLYGSKNRAGFTIPDENNYKKLFTTKGKLSITLDDEKKVITLETPGKNSITISDEAKGIVLKDQNGNSITLNDSGIELKSAKDIVLTATGNVQVKATGKVDISATQDLIAKGLNVQAEAQVGLTAKGTATAELSASGNTTVKGAIVMIN